MSRAAARSMQAFTRLDLPIPGGPSMATTLPRALHSACQRLEGVELSLAFEQIRVSGGVGESINDRGCDRGASPMRHRACDATMVA